MDPSEPLPPSKTEAPDRGPAAVAALLQDPDLRRVLDVLNPAGEETRVVGGAVRNALLGLRPGDMDLATTMPPDEVARRARAARLRAIPTGIAHGTITLLSAGQPFEVTTLRQDVETDGRHAVVRFGRDFALDARRRDFTINALSLGLDGVLHDTVGGQADLAARRVRFIGDAATRIREDVLRILRFFRFHAAYGAGALDEEGFEAAARHREALSRLSRERVRAEMMKILAAPRVLDALRPMHEAGILDLVLGGPGSVDALARLIAFEPANPDPIPRLAALAGHASAETERLRDRLRLTNAETRRLDAMERAKSDLTATGGGVDDAALLRLLVAYGRDAASDAIRMQAASGAGAGWEEALAFVGGSPIPVLPAAGGDLLRRGLQGPAVGAALARLRELWAEAGFPADNAVIEALLDRAIAERAARPS